MQHEWYVRDDVMRVQLHTHEIRVCGNGYILSMVRHTSAIAINLASLTSSSLNPPWRHQFMHFSNNCNVVSALGSLGNYMDYTKHIANETKVQTLRACEGRVEYRLHFDRLARGSARQRAAT